MKLTNVVLAFGFSISVLAQPGSFAGLSASKAGLGGFSIQTRIEPPSPVSSTDRIGSGVITSDTWFHRYLTDREHKKYFGYDFLIEPAGKTNAFRLSFRPLSIGPERFADTGSWTPLPPPQYPGPQTVNAGDTIALDLLTNAATQQRIADYLVIHTDARTVTASGPARDFSAEDAELRIMSPRLSVNGKFVQEPSGAAGIIGADYWFYLAGQGRFVFSLAPQERLGYYKSGEVRGSTLTFTVGGNAYVLNCDGRIAPGSDAYNLYVHHDPSYRPKGADSGAAFLEGAGR